MKVESVPVAELRADPRNARTHDDRNVDAIAASLKRFGQQKPIVVDAEGVVRAGNGTLAAAVLLGWREVAVVRTKLSGDDAAAYAIADNRTAELAGWDERVLYETLESFSDDALFDATGFTQEEWEDLGERVDPTPPASFPDAEKASIAAGVDHRCPRCGYAWSGEALQPAPDEGVPAETH